MTQFFEELTRLYKEYRCDALWDLGDLTDDRTAIPVPVIDLLCDLLEPFDGKWNLKLVGNHEQWLRSTKVHAGKMFRRFFHVVDTTEALRIEKVNILCASYNDDNEATLKFLRRQPKLETSVLLGHFQVAGCSSNSGVLQSGIPREEIAYPVLTLLGHIHRPQQIGNTNIHYVGSPFQQDWGEAGQCPRVALVEIKDGQIVDFKWLLLSKYAVYRQVSFEEFVRCVEEKSEDRYKVVLRSLEETEKFYGHPLSSRADEAVFAYDTPAPAAGAGSDEIPRSRQDILARYLKKSPPGELGIPYDEETMLEFAEMITTPE